jgi:hypothetical protein
LREFLLFFQNRINVQLNMFEQENGQLPLARRTVRHRISADVWQQVKTAYASGIGLREIARNMSIPEGTVLARAKREGWTQQIHSIKALAKRDDTSTAVTPFEAVSASMQQRGERHVGRMANIVEKTLPHVEAMQPGAVLDCIDDVDTLDKVARRTFGLGETGHGGNNVMVNVALLGIPPERMRAKIEPSGD